MVDAVATRDPDGRVALVLWNGTVDVSKSGGDRLLDRRVDLAIDGLPADRYRLRHRRLDERHSNINRAWDELRDGAPWPDADGWAALHEADRLDDLEPPRDVSPDGGAVHLTVELPMPAVSLIELHPF